MSDLSGVGRLLIVAGIVLALLGVGFVLAPRTPGLDRLGRLPGDIVIERGPLTVFIPLVSSIVITALLTIVVNLFTRR